MEKFYKIIKIGESVNIPSHPEEDLGFSWDTHSNYTILPKPGNFFTDVGLINIDDLLAQLQILKNLGSNYVACEYHDDHEELDVSGFEFREATEEEIISYKKDIAKKELERKEEEIKLLEKKLNQLKSK